MSTPEPAPPARPIAVVGIGASAGGVAALETFFGALPKDTGAAFVVAMHLAPERESHLPRLLARASSLPVRELAAETTIEADHVYVLPPSTNLAIDGSRLRPEPSPEPRPRMPIDRFLAALAEAKGPNAVGVLLSGTGSDGTAGLRRLEAKGGLTLVQDPEEAEFDGMPASAIATGVVDLILPVAEMPERIVAYLRTRPHLPRLADGESLGAEGQQALHGVLARVRARTGRELTRYKQSTLVRRLRRRMQLHHVEDVDAYTAILESIPDEAQALSDELLISVTNFFRDPRVFEPLERDVIPKLFDHKAPEDRVRVWSVGCATGEEAYSLAMLLMEEASRRSHPPHLQVFASDLHPAALERARQGFYPKSIEEDVSTERLRRHFVAENGGYRIRREVREIVVFAQHNLLSDPPFSQLDLVSCRNVLIYLKRDAQGEVLELFHYALVPGGYLLLGTSESVDRPDLFRASDKKRCIFQRRGGAASEPHLPVFPLSPARARALPIAPGRTSEPASYGTLHQAMVERYAPPSVLVDRSYDTLHVSEHAGRYLQVPAGTVTTNLVKLVREELRMELRAALHTAFDEGEGTRSPPIGVNIEGDLRDVVMRVEPARDPEEGLCLVIFDETGETRATPGASESRAGGETLRALEDELSRTRQRMQSIIEEYETAQEEMKASNEELQSTNEELRSTMEELETSKEELQSVNEELTTLNHENHHRVEELSQLTADLNNLLTATEIATLFLDRSLRILRFTPRVSDLFNVRASDRGRPLSDITHRLGYPALQEDAALVLKQLIPVERQVRSESGSWYLARVLPYRTVDDRIDGIVLTFVDVTPLKTAQEELFEARRRLEIALDAGGLGTWELDLTTSRVTNHNTRHDRLFGYEREALEWSWTDILRRVVDEDRPAMEAELRAARERGPFDVEVRVRRPDDGVRWLHFKGRVYREHPGEAGRMLGVVADISERKEAEEALRQWSETLEERVQERTFEVRDLALRLTRAEHQERSRIAHVLHDDLQQLLYAAQMKLGIIHHDAEEAHQPDLVQGLGQVTGTLDSAIDIARRLSVDIDPPVLASEGLTEALRWLGGQMKELHGLEVEVVGDAPLRIADEGIRVLLFQIIRELLFNVVKHAGVHETQVLVAEDEDRARVEVLDRGAGFDVAATEATAASSLGLHGARERLKLAGGRLVLESRPGEGTRAIVEVDCAATRS